MRVRAKDAAGNVEPASSGTFTFDASEPETTIDSSMPDPTNSSSASFDFSADEPGATFECAIDGGAWGACASPKAYTGLSDGGHNFEVRATDPAGNTDDNPAAFNWTIDTVDPTSTASFPAASGRYTAAEWDAGCTAPGLCGTYSDSGVGVVDVEVSIRRGNGNYWTGSGFSSATEVWNDATLAAGDWTYGLDSTDFPADGSYTVRVRARDDAGNTETPSSRTFDFDATAPSSTLAFPAAAGTYNAAGWAAGCATDGLCGSYADGSTGVAEVEVSIRRGTGNYWNGSGFSSATEVWNDATLAAGDWTYGLDSTDFPADGGYTVRFRATDVAGNTESASSRTFTYDTTAPQTTIDSSPTDPTSSTTAAFDVSANEGGSTFECSIDGGAWSACTSPKSYTSLTDGSHTFDVRATDQAGNTDGTPASYTWLVDTTAPSSTTSFPAPGGEYNAAGWDAGCATSGLCGTYGDGSGSGVAEVEVSIRRGNGNYWTGTGFSSATEVWNDATLAAGSWTYGLDCSDFPADGSYTVRVRATDDVGNVETPSSRTFEYDTTDPSALFAFPAAGGEYRTSVWNTGCATVGLCGPQSDSGTGVSDVEVSVQRVSDGLYWDGDSFDAGTESWFAASLAGGNWSYPFAAASFPADGQYVVHVRATDDAGNTEAGPSRTFRIDNTDPSALVTFPAAGTRYSTAGWNAGCATSGLCGTQSDSGSGIAQVEVSLKRVSTDLYWDGDSFDAGGETYFTATLAGGNWSYAFPAGNFPADGDYTLHVRATDDADNTEGGPTRTFTYDTTPPQTTIDANPADPTASTSGSFDFSSDEGSSTFECRIDGGAWSACTSPKSYTSLTDGSHTFDVRATDAAGNTDGTPATYTWLVDTAAPSSTIGFPAASGEYNVAGWNAGCATSGLCGTYSDGSGSGVDQVRVSVRRVSTGLYWNGASFSSAPEVLLNTGLAGGNWTRAFPASNFPADGDYTVSVFATDDVGNAETPSALTFHFDATDPTGSLTAPADGAALRGSSVTVSSDSADTGSGVDSAEFQRRPAGGGAWTTIATDTNAPYAANWDTTSLADGDYDLRVITTDAAGNTFTSATRTVTVDNTAPSAATLDTLPAAIRNGQGLTGSGSDATSGVDSLTYLYCVGTSCSPSTPIGSSTTGPEYTVTWASQPADGDVRVRVRVTDSAGNSLDSAVQGVEVDNTNPTGSLTAPADASVLGGNSVTVSSDSADTGSGVDSAEFQRRPAGGGAWTTIATDTNAPYAANWDTTSLADGDYDLRVITTDAAGNTFTSATRTVTVDNSDPTVTITAPTGFVNGAAADPFTVTATTPDGDVAGIELFRCSNASTGCSTGSWVSLGVDASAPYSALWTIDADGNRALRAVATDGAGITGSDLVDITIDRTNPTGSLTAPADGSFVTGTVIVSSDSADTGSGVDSAEFQRRPAGGGAWTTIANDTNAPYAANWDTTSLADGDHELRVITTDAAGNTFTSATRTVTVDNTAPSAPLVTLVESSPFAHVNGSEIFVNTDETGTYDVQATSSDAHSGIDKVRFPGPTDDSSSPYETSYGLGDLSGGQSVTAFNGVGLTASSPFTVTPDTAEPSGGSVGYASGYDADGDVAITVDAGTDALSGLAAGSAVLERRTASLADGTCDPFAGVWSTVTSPDTIASGLCAQYRYRVADRVGNEAVYTSAHVVKVDLVNPAAPVLTLDESSPYAHVVGTEIFVNTSQSGSYDVGASTSDAVSGIDKVVFPGGVEDTSAPYSATYDFDDLGGTETVTAHDRAGNTASSDFEVTEDVTAPSTTDDTASIGSAWQTAPVTVTLSPTDGRSGVAETYYTTDGSVPTTSSPEGTEIDLTADGVYVIHYFSVDNVGNAEPVRTALVTIRIDQTDPGAPSISLSESSPYAHVAGSEIFVNTAQTGTYDVSATSSDAGSGIARIVFPNGVEDTTSPYAATYDLDDLSGSQTVTAHDAAGNTASDTFTVTPDTAAPAGGSVSYPDGYDADGTVTVTVDAGTDALSGVDASSGVLERDTSALAGGVCDPFAGAWITVTSPDTVASGLCAQYRYRVADRVGNEVIYTLPTSTAQGRPRRPADDHRRRAGQPQRRRIPVVRLLVERTRLDLRVPPRRRRLGSVHEPEELREPHRRQPRLPGARHGRRRPHRRDARLAHVGGRHGRTGHDARRLADGSVQRRRPLLRLLGERAGRDLRVSSRRRGLGRVHEPRDGGPARRRQPSLPGARRRCRRQRRPLPRLARMDGRHGRAGLVLHGRPIRSDQRHHTDLRVHGDRGRLHVPVPPRRRRLGPVLEPGDDRPATRWQPHVRGPRNRRGRQPGDGARVVHLARRRGHDLGLDHAAEWLRQRGRLRSVHGHGDQPGRRRHRSRALQLLRREHQLLDRLVGLARHRHCRAVRGLLARRRGRQPRPARRRDRRRLQHRLGRRQRHHRPHRPRHLARLGSRRPEPERGRELRLQLERGRRELRVPPRRRRLGRLLEPEELCRPRRGQPHLPCPRDRCCGQRRPDAGDLRLDGRHRRPAGHDRRSPERPERQLGSELRVLLVRGLLQLPVPPRRRCLGRLREPARLHGPCGRQPHLPGARDRCRRQRRRHARGPHVDDRRDRPRRRPRRPR